MVKWTLLFIFFTGCATPPPASQVPEAPQVSIDVALEHIGQSYTLGCVEALKKRGESNIYPWCRERGIRHQSAVKQMIDGSTEANSP